MRSNKRALSNNMALESINDIINLLDATNKTLDSKIKVFSSNDELTVKLMNAHHSKNIIKSAVDGPYASTQFNLVIYNILKDVVDYPLKNLNIYDKNIILLQLRERNISDTVEVDLYSDEEDVAPIKSKVNLTKLIAKLTKDTGVFPDSHVDIETHSVRLLYPSIEDEYKFEDNFYKTKLTTIDDKSDKAKRSLIVPMMFNNIAQYVVSASFGGQTFDLTARSVNERLAIVEKLPSKLLTQIMHTIDNTYGKPLVQMLKISSTRDGKDFTGALDINAGFFLAN